MDSKNNGSFWPSYVDIMTTLFAITLVLFAVSFSRFKIKEKQLQSLVDQYENIITVYSTVGKIDSTRYFNYNEQYLKHLFTVDVEYQIKEFHIDRLELDREGKIQEANQKRKDIIEAGNIVKNTIESLEKSDSINNNIKFLVVIEGQSSKIAYNESEWKNNYTLSYLRAQYLNKFWQEKGIDIESIPRCELVISGSGEGGVPRVPELQRRNFASETDFRRAWEKEEAKNQRFLIHIVPVIGNIDGAMEELNRLNGHK